MAKKDNAEVEAAMAADAAGNLIIRENNAEQIESLIHGAIASALEEIGLVAEGHAKRLCPVDTGRLRNSVTHAIDSVDESVYIGTNVEYGKYVELGTSRSKAKPFLVPAASDHSEQYRSILKRHLDGSK